MAKYKISRKDINIGAVVRPFIRAYDEENLTDVQIIQFNNIRLTLFSINENKLANDLLYKSPEYPIEHLSNPKDCKESKYIIHNKYNLEEYLIELGFKEKLTKRDLKKLRNKLLSLKGTDTIPKGMIGYIRSINNFAPGKYEGKIKRLR